LRHGRILTYSESAFRAPTADQDCETTPTITEVVSGPSAPRINLARCYFKLSRSMIHRCALCRAFAPISSARIPLPYMDPGRLQEPLLFFEIPVAAIYSTSLNGRMFCYYRPSHDVSRAPGALHGGDLFLINRAMAEHSFARCRSDRMSSI